MDRLDLAMGIRFNPLHEKDCGCIKCILKREVKGVRKRDINSEVENGK